MRSKETRWWHQSDPNSILTLWFACFPAEHVDVNSLSESLANRCDKGGGGRDRDLAALSQPTAGDQDELMRRCDRVVHIAQRLWHEMSEPGEERLLTHDGSVPPFHLCVVGHPKL